MSTQHLQFGPTVIPLRWGMLTKAEQGYIIQTYHSDAGGIGLSMLELEHGYYMRTETIGLVFIEPVGRH